ncbi:MAG: hypothetical protein PVF58_20145 [Candidatus Methanofastidiosia archaeon]
MASWISGTLTTIDTSSYPPEMVNLLKENIAFLPTKGDLSFFIAYLVAVSLYFLMKRFFLYIPQTFSALYRNNILKKKKGSKEKILTDYNNSLKDFENRINGSHIYVPAFSLFFILILNFLIHREEINELDILVWNDINFFPLNWTVLIIVSSLMWFMVGIFIWKMYCVVYFMKELAQQYEFALNPYNLDRFGGFKPLGRLWLNIGLIIIPILLFYVNLFIFYRFFRLPYPLIDKYYDIVLIASYTIVITVLLIYPMQGYHNIIKNQKTKLLGNVETRIDRPWQRVEKRLLSGRRMRLPKYSVKQLDQIDTVASKIQNIPSWPFTSSEKISIVLSVIVPWVVEILGRLIGLFQGTS